MVGIGGWKMREIVPRSKYSQLRKRTLHPNSLTKTEWAYVAGVFDGEGCVLARYRKNVKGHELRFSITNTNMELLEWLCARIGGYIVKTAPNKYSRKPCCVWQLGRANDCYVMAHMILPYVIVKKVKLLQALQFCEEKWQLQEQQGIPEMEEEVMGLS
jgi:hypothetical protein